MGSNKIVLDNIFSIIIGLIMLFGMLRLMVKVVSRNFINRILSRMSVVGWVENNVLMFLKLVLRVLGNKVLLIVVSSLVSNNC